MQLCEGWGRVLGGKTGQGGQQDDRAGQGRADRVDRADRADRARTRQESRANGWGETNLGRFWLSNQLSAKTRARYVCAIGVTGAAKLTGEGRERLLAEREQRPVKGPSGKFGMW